MVAVAGRPRSSVNELLEEALEDVVEWLAWREPDLAVSVGQYVLSPYADA